MKFRIDKLPKSEEDLEKIQEEVESEHGHEHEHHHHHEHDVLEEILFSVQSLEGRLNQVSNDAEYCRKEVKRIYLILSKLVRASFETDSYRRIQILRELKDVLESS